MKILRYTVRPSGIMLFEFSGDKFALVKPSNPFKPGSYPIIDCYRLDAKNSEHAREVGDSVRARMVAKLRKAGHVQ